jgi:hypothetical protein
MEPTLSRQRIKDGGSDSAFYDRAMAILDQLSTYAFAGKNEATIRDNWIVPLLGLLGYGQGSNLYERVSEAPLKLRTPHRKIGSSTLYVDFVPTVMKQRFWILKRRHPTMMRAFWAQLKPWAVENLIELAAGAEELLAQIKTEWLAMLGPAHDLYLDRWQVADPLIECTLIALERYGGSLGADEEVSSSWLRPSVSTPTRGWPDSPTPSRTRCSNCSRGCLCLRQAGARVACVPAV